MLNSSPSLFIHTGNSVTELNCLYMVIMTLINVSPQLLADKFFIPEITLVWGHFIRLLLYHLNWVHLLTSEEYVYKLMYCFVKLWTCWVYNEAHAAVQVIAEIKNVGFFGSIAHFKTFFQREAKDRYLDAEHGRSRDAGWCARFPVEIVFWPRPYGAPRSKVRDTNLISIVAIGKTDFFL